ncbi:high mobility group box domain-containing protein, partial [Russula earlei]
MRHCANVADQFAQMLTQASFNGVLLPGGVQAGSKRHGTEEEDVEGATKKRRTISKKAKDPDAPKRAASSYLFFQNDLRQELRKQHPEISSAEVMSRVSKQWAEMTSEQKAPYERLQAEAKQRWEAEKRAYDERRGIVTPKPASRMTAAIAAEEPVQPATVGSTGVKLGQKNPESSGSST